MNPSLFFFLAALLLPLPAPQETSVADDPAGADALPFPRSFEGRWVGIMTIDPLYDRSSEVDMVLEVRPTEDPRRFTWIVETGRDDRLQVRESELRELDLPTAQGAGRRFRLDHHNSIEIESYWLGGVLYQRFQIGPNFLFASYRRVGDAILYELVRGDRESERSSGGEDGLPTVQSYPITVVQRAVLVRAGSEGPRGDAPGADPADR